MTSVADQGSTTRYRYDDEGRLAIERGPTGETSFVNRFYTVRNGTVAWKQIWAGTERIATKREMPEDEYEHRLYFIHKDLLGSTNLVTDPNGQVFEYLQYFPGGETWVLEHSDIHRVPYLYGGGYYDEFRELYNLGARWYEPREQLFYSPDPALMLAPRAPIDDPALLEAYSYAENNPLRLVDRDGRAAENALSAFQAVFYKPDGSLDAAKEGVSGSEARLVARVAAIPKHSPKAAFKAFVNWKAPALVSVNLKRTSDGLKLKHVEVLGVNVSKFRSILKQSTPKKDKP